MSGRDKNGFIGDVFTSVCSEGSFIANSMSVIFANMMLVRFLHVFIAVDSASPNVIKFLYKIFLPANDTCCLLRKAET